MRVCLGGSISVIAGYNMCVRGTGRRPLCFLLCGRLGVVDLGLAALWAWQGQA